MQRFSSNEFRRFRAPLDVAARVAVLDDHVVVRYCLELLVKNEAQLAWAGAVNSSTELYELLANSLCHVVVLDYELAPSDIDGWNLVRKLRARFPHVAILVYTAHDSISIAALMKRAGAHGFVSKSMGLRDLVAAIGQVADGRQAFPTLDNVEIDSSASPPIVEEIEQFQDPAETHELMSKLSPRESEVLRCCLQGMSVTDVASKFMRSVKTVSTQKQAAFRKLGIRNDLDLFAVYGKRS